MPLTYEQKLIFLNNVLEKKTVLFGSFNNKAEGAKSKAQGWQEICEKLHIYGYTGSYSNLRDVVWNNLRARAISKRDNNRRTGAKAKTLDSVDTLVLNILGNDSAVLDGIADDSVSFLHVANTVPAAASFVDMLNSDENTDPHIMTLINKVPAVSGTTTSGAATTSFKRRRTAVVQHDEEVDALRIKRFKLQIRKLELEIKKLENDLGEEHIPI